MARRSTVESGSSAQDPRACLYCPSFMPRSCSQCARCRVPDLVLTLQSQTFRTIQKGQFEDCRTGGASKTAVVADFCPEAG